MAEKHFSGTRPLDNTLLHQHCHQADINECFQCLSDSKGYWIFPKATTIASEDSATKQHLSNLAANPFSFPQNRTCWTCPTDKSQNYPEPKLSLTSKVLTLPYIGNSCARRLLSALQSLKIYSQIESLCYSKALNGIQEYQPYVRSYLDPPQSCNSVVGITNIPSGISHMPKKKNPLSGMMALSVKFRCTKLLYSSE